MRVAETTRGFGEEKRKRETQDGIVLWIVEICKYQIDLFMPLHKAAVISPKVTANKVVIR